MRKLLLAAAMCAAHASAWAETRISGLTFSTWTDNSYYQGPSLPYDGYVVVGNSASVGQWYQYGGQYTSIRSEFDLLGQQAASNVMLSFRFDGRSTVTEAPQTASMPVALSWYAGDNLAKVSDWRVIETGPGYFTRKPHPTFGEIDAATFASGQVLSFDVTSLFNSALARGDAALGIGLDHSLYSFQYAQFSDFAITVTAVPEPSTYALMLGGLALCGVARRRAVAVARGAGAGAGAGLPALRAE